MTEAWILASYAFALAGQLGDCYTTEVGLQHGLAEANKVAKWLTGKIGNTGLTLLKCIGAAQVFPFVAYELLGHDVRGFMAAAMPVGVIGVIATIQNYRLLRKNKIAL